ncbi:GSCOCG00005406001-RA-CDS, partial [Cotesia congregata]
VRNKEEDFWVGIREWDVVVLIETWVNRKKWTEIRESWKKGFKWQIQEAKLPKGRGRAKGGILVGVKEGIEIRNKGKWDEEGWAEVEVLLGGEWWWIIGVYINGDMGRKKELMSKWMDEAGDERILFGGDFNARTASEGGLRTVDDQLGRSVRRSKDNVYNKDGKELCSFLEEKGWAIVNGCVKGDEEGEWTFVGERGCSVIDLVLIDERSRDRIMELRIEERTDSDHLTIVVKVEVQGKRSREGYKERINRTGRGVWTQEGRSNFQEEFGNAGVQVGNLDEDWRRLKERIRGAIRESEKTRVKSRGVSSWWDEECREGKGKLRRSLQSFRKKKIPKEEYFLEKKTYKKLCEEKKRLEKQRWE